MKRRSFLKFGAATVALGSSSLRATTDAPRPSRRGPGPVRLSSNENPLGLSPRARAAVVEVLAEGHLYPWNLRRSFEQELARRVGVDSDTLVVGAGSAQVNHLAVRAFGTRGGVFVAASPSFEGPPRYAESEGLRVVRVPLGDDRAHDLDAMTKAAAGAKGPAVVYVCNPNNPTGTVTPVEELRAWIAAAPEDLLILVDEAYHDYGVGDPRYASLVAQAVARPGTVVARTFSKIYAMAGLRLGYGVAHPETAGRLNAICSRNNVSCAALAAGSASLDDAEFHSLSLKTNARSREILTDALDELEVAHLPSRANFVMHRVRGRLDVYQRRMRDAGFLVGRAFPPMTEWNRVSLGLPSEMERFVETLRTFRGKGWV